MYAIRSYYGIVLRQGGERRRSDLPGRPGASEQAVDGVASGLEALLEAVALFAAVGVGRRTIVAPLPALLVARRDVADEAQVADIVITSYSIHYTKLYEWAATTSGGLS